MKIPKLRFKEFSGEWEEKSILEIVKDEKNSIKIGPFGSQLKKERFVEKSDFKVYGQENVISKDFSIGDRYMTESHFKELSTNEIKSGDFLISSMGTIGHSIIVPEGIERGIMDSHLIRLRLKNEIANSKFIQQIFLFDKTQNKILSLSVGGIMAGLSIGIIKKLFFTLPNLQEQEKIGNFLSSVDKKISITEEKLNLFKDYKKGMMQKIFKQEIRFKDSNGNNYPEWEEKKLGDFYDFKYGQFNTNPSNGGEYPVYGANGVIGGYTSYNAEKSVIIGHMGAYAGSVLWEEKKHFVTYNGTISKPKNEKGFDSKYGYYLLNSLNIMKICAGSGQPFLAYETLNKIKVKSSFIFEEQEKIAKFLSSIDNKIENLSNELENLKLFKKGLLQKMFI